MNELDSPVWSRKVCGYEIVIFDRKHFSFLVQVFDGGHFNAAGGYAEGRVLDSLKFLNKGW